MCPPCALAPLLLKGRGVQVEILFRENELQALRVGFCLIHSILPFCLPSFSFLENKPIACIYSLIEIVYPRKAYKYTFPIQKHQASLRFIRLTPASVLEEVRFRKISRLREAACFLRFILAISNSDLITSFKISTVS